MIWAEHSATVQTDPGGNSYAQFNLVFYRQLWFAMISLPPVSTSITICLGNGRDPQLLLITYYE